MYCTSTGLWTPTESVLGETTTFSLYPLLLLYLSIFAFMAR